MAKKTEGAAKAPKSATTSKGAAANNGAAAPLTDTAPVGEVAKTTKARATSVPPKSRPAAAPATSPAAMVNGTSTSVTGGQPTDAQIREHAYHLWKNGTPGDCCDHWYAAERALRGDKR